MNHIDINLIQTKTKPKEWILIAVFLVLIVMVSGLYLWTSYQDLQQKVIQLEQSIESKLTLPVAGEGDTSSVELQRYQSVVDLASTMPYSKVVLLLELSKKLPERGYFTSFLYSGSSVELEVQFDTNAEAAFYLTSLQKLQVVKEAKVLSVTKNTLSQDTSINEETFVQPRTIASYSIELNEEVLKEYTSEQEDPS